jgi:hypothetical protein
MIIGLTFLYELIKIKSLMTYLTYVREQITQACVIQIFFRIGFLEMSLSQFFLHP